MVVMAVRYHSEFLLHLTRPQFLKHTEYRTKGLICNLSSKDFRCRVQGVDGACSFIYSSITIFSQEVGSLLLNLAMQQILCQ